MSESKTPKSPTGGRIHKWLDEHPNVKPYLTMLGSAVLTGILTGALVGAQKNKTAGDVEKLRKDLEKERRRSDEMYAWAEYMGPWGEDVAHHVANNNHSIRKMTEHTKQQDMRIGRLEVEFKAEDCNCSTSDVKDKLRSEEGEGYGFADWEAGTGKKKAKRGSRQ